MERKKINALEQKALNQNIIPIFIMGASGLVLGSLSHSSAIVLDGMFSTVLFTTVILAKVISFHANKPRDNTHPLGYWMLENLYVLFKIVVLLTILLISLFESSVSLIEYYIFNSQPEVIIPFYTNIYYLVKLAAFSVSLIIYSRFYNASNKQSDILKLEKKSVTIDGVITLSIFLGFIVLGKFEATKEISDSIILFSISLFLIRDVLKEFSHELCKTIGKRILRTREMYYRSMFNNYFAEFEFSDVYIHFVGKVAIVSLTGNFKGDKSVDDLCKMEREIKKLMYSEFDKIHLNTYWDKCCINYYNDFELKK